MRLVVISCAKYADAWLPCFELIRRFYPEASPFLITDTMQPANLPAGIRYRTHGDGTSWCAILADFALHEAEPILLMQEDFLLNAPVKADQINHAMSEMKRRRAGMVRVYPCPGATDDYGDNWIGSVRKGTPYRISCQASIWEPVFLHMIASQCRTPYEFEVKGTLVANDLPYEVLAWKREVTPWPMEYFCSAISRGRWNPDAIELCKRYGIAADFSRRPVDA